MQFSASAATARRSVTSVTWDRKRACRSVLLRWTCPYPSTGGRTSAGVSGVRVESGEREPELRDRVQRLLAFLAELVKARSAPVRVVDKHRAVMSLEEGNIRAGLRAHAAS